MSRHRGSSITICFAVLSLLSTLLACNQQPDSRQAVEQTGHIEGTITVEGADKDAGVLVSVAGAATETSADGTFRIEDIPAGERQLEAHKEGWERHTEVVTVQANTTKTVNVTLKPEGAGENADPTIASFGIDTPQMAAGATARVSVTASDPDGDALSYDYSADGGFTVEGLEDEPGAEVTAPDDPGIRGTITLVVEDENGGTAEASLAVRTTENTAPTVAALSASPPQLEPGAGANVEASVTDADGDELTYNWKPPEGWSVEGSGASVTLNAPDDYDARGTLELTVEDAHGATGSGRLAVSTIDSPGSPTISSVSAASPQLAAGGTTQLSVSASDPAGGPLSYQWNAPAEWSFDDATRAQPNLTAPDNPGEQASISVDVTGASGKTATATLLVSTRDNQPPLLASLAADSSVVSPGGSVEITASAQDPDGDSLSYTWSAPNEWSPSSMGNTVSLTAPDSYGARAKVEVTISDGTDSTKGSVTVVTETNRAPSIANVSGRPLPVSAGGTVDLSASAQDPNGDSLSYTWSAANSDWTLKTTTGPSVQLQAPDQNGAQTDVTVEVTDDAGGKASASITADTLDCPSGWADCDKSAANGCETNLRADPANCGSCGSSCNAGQNAVATCSQGSCGLRCKGDYGDCDGNAGNGCETDLRSADDNCGRCGNVCQGANNADGVCNNRSCTISCKPGYKDCDGNPGNGCEAADSGIAQGCAAPNCQAIQKAGHADGDGLYWIDPNGGSTSDAYEAYCDMTTDGGGWTLLGTISGSDADNWNDKIGNWGNTNTLGTPSKPYQDFKSKAWVNLDVSNAQILFQRRYNGKVRSQVVLNSCTRGKTHFYQLFTKWQPNQLRPACNSSDMNVLQTSSVGVNSSNHQEGKNYGLAGPDSQGMCWNGRDDYSNNFSGHLFWTNPDDTYTCEQVNHSGGVGVWRNGDSQYTNSDITDVNWLSGVNHSKVDVSLFAR